MNGIVTAAAAGVLLFALSPRLSQAQTRVVPFPGAVRPTTAPPKGPAGPVPHMPDGKPDLSGIWNGQRALPNQPEPEMLSWAAALTKQRTENYSADDPEARCIPAGVPQRLKSSYCLGASELISPASWMSSVRWSFCTSQNV